MKRANQKYQKFITTLPLNLKPIVDIDDQYNMYRAWLLYGQPENAGQAASRGLIAPQYDGTIHAGSVGYNKETNNYELLKSNLHGSRTLEDIYGYYLKPNFNKNWKVERSKLGKFGYDKYVPRNLTIPHLKYGSDGDWTKGNGYVTYGNDENVIYSPSPLQEDENVTTWAAGIKPITIQGNKPNNKGFKWVSPKNPRMLLMNIGDFMKGVHAATNPLLAWTSPSQYWGAIRDSNSPSEFVKNMMLGNSGFLDEKTAEEYPWLNAALSVVGDGIGTKAAVGTAKNISRIYNNVKNRNAFFYKYLEPFSYGGPFRRGANVIKHILRDPELNNDYLVPEYNKYVFGNSRYLSPYAKDEIEKFTASKLTDEFRDEAYRKYLNLPEKTPLYIDNGDNTFSYNIPYIKEKFRQHGLKMLPWIADNAIPDYLTGNGGMINSKIKLLTTDGKYNIQHLEDLWDLLPFSENGRLLSDYVNKYAKILNGKLTKPIVDKLSKRVSKFEVGKIMNGKPFQMKTDVPVTQTFKYDPKSGGIYPEFVVGDLFDEKDILPGEIFDFNLYNDYLKK